MSSIKFEKTIYHGCFFSLIITLLLSNFIIVPVLVQMIFYTFSLIYIGSHISLRQLEVDPKTGQSLNKTDSLDHKDALLFPVFGSFALVSLYLAYKFLDPWYVNALIVSYLTVLGVVALADILDSSATAFLEKYFFKNRTFKLSLNNFICRFFMSEEDIEKCGVKISLNQIIFYLISIWIAYAWLTTKYWVYHNIFAMAFCIQAISLISVGSFKIATILLIGLFFYDIFWVFGTDVMVTVARSFDGPAKLIFPVSFSPWRQSILGLGDIVIPGIFIAMCLRYDKNFFLTDKDKDSKKVDGQKLDSRYFSIDIHAKFSKFYFWLCIFSYEIGVVTTTIVMMIFQAPQPALLYLVPFCLFALFGGALLNGEVKNILEYDENRKSCQLVGDKTD